MTSCKHRFGDRHHRLLAVTPNPPAIARKYDQESRDASFWRPNERATPERVGLNRSAKSVEAQPCRRESHNATSRAPGFGQLRRLVRQDRFHALVVDGSADHSALASRFEPLGVRTSHLGEVTTTSTQRTLNLAPRIPSADN
jgi:hypothetical protein